MDDTTVDEVPDVEDSPGRRALVVVVAAAVGVLGLVVGVALTVGAVLVLAVLGVELQLTSLVVLSLVLTQGVAFGGVALAYVRLRDLGPEFLKAGMPSLGHLGWVVGGYVLALAGAFVGGSLATLLELEPASNQIGEIGMQNPEILLLLVPLSFLLIGPGEELLFRGVVQGSVRQVFGPVTGVVLASAIFAAVHWVALTGGASGRLVTIGILFLPSLVFGAAYERTGNLVVPALIHGAYNATLFGVVYLSTQMDLAATGLL